MDSEHMLVVADMCIDLACATNRREEIGAAEDYLIRLTMLRHEDEAEPQQTAEHAIAARLRLAELPNWRAGLDGNPVALGYDDMLEAVEEIAHSYGEQSRDVMRFIEFMPILLGARNMQWIGRLSLLRESDRPIIVPSVDPNWSVGLFTNDTKTLETPDKRLKIKKNRLAVGRSGSTQRSRPSRSRAAGVVPISAREHRFENPLRVALSCLRDAGGIIPSALTDVQLFSRKELDKTTRRLENSIHREAPQAPAEDDNQI